MQNSSRLVFLALAASVCAQAGPVYYFITGHTMAQTQIDSVHSTVFYSPTIGDPGLGGGSVSVSDLDPAFDWQLGGGEFLMKDGSQTPDDSTGDLNFEIWENDMSGSPLAIATFTEQEFDDFKLNTYGDSDQTFGNDGNTVNFDFATPVTLQAGHHYIAALTTGTPTSQNAAYFIKGLAGPLNIQDPNGDPLTDPAPEPATGIMALGMLSALAWKCTRARTSSV